MQKSLSIPGKSKQFVNKSATFCHAVLYGLICCYPMLFHPTAQKDEEPQKEVPRQNQLYLVPYRKCYTGETVPETSTIEYPLIFSMSGAKTPLRPAISSTSPEKSTSALPSARSLNWLSIDCSRFS